MRKINKIKSCYIIRELRNSFLAQLFEPSHNFLLKICSFSDRRPAKVASKSVPATSFVIHSIIQKIIFVFLLLIAPYISLADINVTTFSPDNIRENSVTLSGNAYNISETKGGGLGGYTYPIFGHFIYSKYPPKNNSCNSMTNFFRTADVFSQPTLATVSLKANISNLELNTTYYYCAVASNNSGTGLNLTYGNIVDFKTTTPPPENTNRDIVLRSADTKPDLIKNVRTYSIDTTRLSDTEALFQGSVESVGPVAYGYFRYSKAIIPPIFCNDIFGSNMRSVTATVPNKTGLVTPGFFYGGATDLAPDTDYYYCAVVSNSTLNPTEIDYGKVIYFRTLPCATCDKEIIRTKRASIINSKSVILRGYYNFSRKVETYFQYRKKIDATENVEIERDDGFSSVEDKWLRVGAVKQDANTSKDINFTLTKLVPNTIYEYRAVADAEAKISPSTKVARGPKTFYGEIFSFKTPKYDGLGPLPTTCPSGWTGIFPDCADPNAEKEEDNPNNELPNTLYPPDGPYPPEGPYPPYFPPLTCKEMGLEGVYPSCKMPDPTCKELGLEGTYPNCSLPTLTCEEMGLGGTQPNCSLPTLSCEEMGLKETQPNCSLPTLSCEEMGLKGTQPNCEGPKTTCQALGLEGTYPACKQANPTCKSLGLEGAYPKCKMPDPSCKELGLEGTYPKCSLPPLTCSQIGLEGTYPKCNIPYDNNGGNFGDDNTNNPNNSIICGPGTDDIDCDGIPNIIDPDTDGDGKTNILDPDDDNDGIPDLVDGNPTGKGTLKDYDGGGIPNLFDHDMDGDGMPNILDTDDDNDGILDNLDTSSKGPGTNMDYDGDGILNQFDSDMDGDGNPNINDLDVDGDGKSNILDPDADNDGLLNSSDSSPYGFNSNKNTKIKLLVLGAQIEPNIDDIVRYHEGVETVFARRIKKSSALQKRYGYSKGINLQQFAWDLAHILAKEFGYVDKNGREIRVSKPDVSAYQLRLSGNKLTVYEFYKNKIIDIRSIFSAFKNKNPYEYYFKK